MSQEGPEGQQGPESLDPYRQHNLQISAIHKTSILKQVKSKCQIDGNVGLRLELELFVFLLLWILFLLLPLAFVLLLGGVLSDLQNQKNEAVI